MADNLAGAIEHFDAILAIVAELVAVHAALAAEAAGNFGALVAVLTG